MKRIGMFGCVFGLCLVLTGCGQDTHEGLVQETITRMRAAATEVGIITAKVTEATEEAKKGKKLDLSAASKAAEKLKDTGMRIVEIKQRIDMVKSKITDAEKKEYAESNKGAVSEAFGTLQKQKVALREALAVAETYDKGKVDELRKKIVEAESPFEAQTR